METYIGQAVPLGIPIPEATLDLPVAPPRKGAITGPMVETGLWLGLGALALTVFSGALAESVTGASVALKALWVLLAIAMFRFLMTHRLSELFGPMSPFLPVFVIGMLSAVVALQPLDAIRAVLIWLLSLMMAAMVGKGLGERKTAQMLATWFLLTLAASIALAVLVPKIGHDIDLRYKNTWRGLFPGKNWLGWYGGYGALLAVFAPGLYRSLRVALVVVALPCIYFAHSAGSTLTFGATLAVALLIAITRRINVSQALQAILLCLIGFALSIVGVLSYEGVLHSLGRSSTLTGRTYIWQAYFNRALDQWLLGAGPGSFTNSSLATADIGLNLQSLGSIATPHNMYIAMFGEIGILGIVAYVIPLLYFAFFDPIVSRQRQSLLLSAMTLQFVFGGMDETRQVFGFGVGMFVLVLVRASFAKTARSAPGGEDEWSELNAVTSLAPLGLPEGRPAIGE